MSTDPNPIDAIRNIDTKRSVVHANPDRPEIVDLLEAEGRMPGIRLQEHVVLVREVAYRLWERAIQRPKLGGGIMFHSSRALPAWKSVWASAISLSSFPALRSAAICWSQICSSYSRNHARNCVSSAGERLWTCCSSCSTVLIEDPCHYSRPV